VFRLHVKWTPVLVTDQKMSLCFTIPTSLSFLALLTAFPKFWSLFNSALDRCYHSGLSLHMRYSLPCDKFVQRKIEKVKNWFSWLLKTFMRPRFLEIHSLLHRQRSPDPKSIVFLVKIHRMNYKLRNWVMSIRSRVKIFTWLLCVFIVR
jgi:hypothetical protein